MNLVYSASVADTVEICCFEMTWIQTLYYVDKVGLPTEIEMKWIRSCNNNSGRTNEILVFINYILLSFLGLAFQFDEPLQFRNVASTDNLI